MPDAIEAGSLDQKLQAVGGEQREVEISRIFLATHQDHLHPIKINLPATVKIRHLFKIWDR